LCKHNGCELKVFKTQDELQKHTWDKHKLHLTPQQLKELQQKVQGFKSIKVDILGRNNQLLVG